jgi:hypothetical protein
MFDENFRPRIRTKTALDGICAGTKSYIHGRHMQGSDQKTLAPRQKYTQKYIQNSPNRSYKFSLHRHGLWRAEYTVELILFGGEGIPYTIYRNIFSKYCFSSKCQLPGNSVHWPVLKDSPYCGETFYNIRSGWSICFINNLEFYTEKADSPFAYFADIVKTYCLQKRMFSMAVFTFL